MAMAIGTRSSMANQVSSMRTSFPSVGFGTSTREHSAKKFYSNEHVKKDNMTYSPGPAAYGQKSLTCIDVRKDKQSKGGVRTEPAYKFGSAVRFDSVKDKRTGSVPGPGAYTV